MSSTLPLLRLQDSCYHWPISSYRPGQAIYAFDMDGTLIRTRSGKKFAVDAEDWQFLYSEVPTILSKLLSEGACIIIITNQKGISSGKTNVEHIRQKVGQIIEATSLSQGSNTVIDHIGLYIASAGDRYRKAWTGIWDLLPPDQLVNVKWYCGDAAGRKTVSTKDFSATDRYFARNKGIPFRTPEEIFLKKAPPCSTDYAPYAAEQYLLPERLATESALYQNQIQLLLDRLKKQSHTVIITVGGPGSGKSSIAKAIRCSLNHTIHLERDALGGAQKKFLRAVQNAIEVGNNEYIVADATHPNKASRDQLITIAESHGWHVLMLHMDVPFELAQHQDAVRVQLGHRSKPVPIVAHRTFYKRFREDVGTRQDEVNAGRWITFNGRDPAFTSLPEYQMRFF